MRRVVRQLRHRDHRQALADARPLDRIVVDEHEAIDADVEPCRDRFEVLRLVVPIGLEGGEIRAAKHHFGMIAKRRFGDLGVVLGADGENDAPLLELLGVMLQGEMGFACRAAFAQHDAVNPVVADHAAPQRVVEIEHQTFLRQAPQGGENAGGEVAVEGRRLRRDFQLALKPAPDVEPGVDPVPLARARDIQNEHAVARRGLAHLVVQPGDDRRRRPGNHAIIAAEQRLAHVDEGLLNDCGAANLARLAPQRPQFGDESPDRAIDFGRARGQRDAGDRFPRAEREQHRLGREPMQR